jgi:dephospho-CoA kinase
MPKRPRAPVIIITGGIGSGKSTVAGVFKKLGARTIEVDRLARRLLKPGSGAWHEILWKFCGAKLDRKDIAGRNLKAADFKAANGRPLRELPWVINTAGTIRRDKLGATVFSSSRALAALNRIMHARLRKLLNDKINLHHKLSARPLVLDMAVYPERAFKGLGDVVVWIRAPGGMRAQRLADSKRMSLEEAAARVRIQWQDKKFEKNADFILPNLGSDRDIRQGAKKIWPHLLARAAGS